MNIWIKILKKLQKPVEKEIKGVSGLEEMARSLIEHFCALNPDMVQHSFIRKQSKSGCYREIISSQRPTIQEKWNVIKGVIDVTNKAEEKQAIPISDDQKNRTIQHKR